jgi:inner membrane protein
MARSLTFKILSIGALLVLLLVPLLMLDGLVRERQQMKRTAARDVSQMWGGPQTLAGPLVAVPYRFPDTAERAGRSGTVYFLPDSLDYDADLAPEVRQRGIFRVPLYKTTVAIRARFGPLDVAAAGVPPSTLQWDDARLVVGVSDPGGLQALVSPTWGGQALETTPGAEAGVLPRTVEARIPAGSLPLGDAGAVDVRADVQLRGSEALLVVPLGKSTDVAMRSPWPSPSFAGAFAPRERTVSDAGFEADWRVLFLNRGYPQVFDQNEAPALLSAALDSDLGVEPVYEGRHQGPRGNGQAVGVRLIETADVYQQAERAAEYGFVFVLLTFTTFFFVEVLGGRRIHPLQYLLVGCAVALFYLLLLAFAEFVPFGAAYLLAAAAILGLIAMYARTVLGSWRLSATVTGLLALFYGYFYVLLQLDAYALLAGSLGLLVMLAAVMYVSRSVDWYGMAPLGAPKPAGGVARSG